MSEYQKDVLSLSDGVIGARIYRNDTGTPIAVKFFYNIPILRGTEKTFKAAHKWADEYIETCKKI